MLLRTGRKPSWALSRRTFLRGAGVAMALPFLDAMRTRAGTQTAPVRFFGFYVPNGMHMPAWTPAVTGALTALDLSPILSGLANVVDDVLVMSNLDNVPGTAQADGAGDHARGTSTFLTSVHPKKTEGSDIQIGPSVDQLIAQAHAGQTRFSSLQLGCEPGGSTGGCDSGYSCAYSRNISWANASTPLAKETNPAAAFDRLFSAIDPSLTPQQVERRRRLKQSVLDFVKADADRLNAKISTADKQKLDQYMTGIREIETRLQSADAGVCEPPTRVGAVPVDVQQYVRAMLDIAAVAFACDLTRSMTFMLGNGGSGRSYGFLGVPDAHHELSHHQDDAAKQAKLQTIDTWEMDQFAYFVEKLKGITDVDDNSVLHNSIALFGSEIADGNAHGHLNMPLVLAGQGGGGITTARHVVMPSGTPVANLYLEILRLCGAEQTTFGDDGVLPLDLT